MARTKKQLKFEQYQNDAAIHTRKRLAQRYPNVYKDISLKDLRNSPSMFICEAQGPCRQLIATLIKGTVVYYVRSQHYMIIHTVLTEAMVRARLTELGMESSFSDRAVKQGITEKYKSYRQYIREGK